ncbi:TPA: hypothetical protein QDC35_005743 [Burkholderia aenigmatica]|nr:hypothetical protein [Burkholderia aenigmatica]HDR9519439.1 hypothetical protein [Burkholderia aenigmatica]HDR9596469.1 hypothetical protein [Burkholderia aenigmatica]HDR9603846.1 hypothetical protein [Burkholderia aenigmatica]HDR9620652.1 hypothetical protein [Burkholderia aenigmatica]
MHPVEHARIETGAMRKIDARQAPTSRQTGRSAKANAEPPHMQADHPAETGDTAGAPETERE